MNLTEAAKALRKKVNQMTFSRPVAFVYNPLDYAFANYVTYAERFGSPKKRAVFLGMNPGPFGMAQTGIPFGDVDTVASWLSLTHAVGVPAEQHPKRPVLGLDCPRVEVSGARLWGAIRRRYVTPEAFFEHFFVANYCPLAFLEESGRNRTPDKLPKSEREALFGVCDEHLKSIVHHLKPDFVIGIGAFAAKRAEICFEGTGIRLGRITHPSPANPHANQNWAERAWHELDDIGVCM